jgi:hypothetical protein
LQSFFPILYFSVNPSARKTDAAHYRDADHILSSRSAQRVTLSSGNDARVSGSIQRKVGDKYSGAM